MLFNLIKIGKMLKPLIYSLIAMDCKGIYYFRDYLNPMQGVGSLFKGNFMTSPNTPEAQFLPLTLTKLLTKIWLGGILLSSLLVLTGCQLFDNSSDIYHAEIKSLGSNAYTVQVDARLEQKALSKTVQMAQQTCDQQGKQRYIQTQQTSTYTHSQVSPHASGFHRLVTTIKCK